MTKTKGRRSRLDSIREAERFNAPDFESLTLDNPDYWRLYTKIMNYANTIYSNKELKAFAIEWIKNNGLEDKLSSVFNLAEINFATIGKICWIETNGGQLQDYSVKFLEDRLKKLQENKENPFSNDSETQVVQAKPKKSPQDQIKEQTNAVIAEFEEAIDSTSFDGTKTPYDTFVSFDGGLNMNIIIDKYTPLLEELNAVVNNTDSSIVEAYKGMSRKAIARERDIVKQIIDDATRFAQNKKASRKPRTVKTARHKTPEKILKDFKYQKENSEFKLSSVDPKKLLGSQFAVLFNTKYKTIEIYYADEGGFSAKGQKITNFKVDTSYGKRVRKPNEFLPEIMSGPKTKVAKSIDGLKTQSLSLTGTVGSDRIILRVM